MTDPGPIRAALSAELDEMDQRIAELTVEFDQIVAGSVFVNTDDEHDPEGATIAFERARAASLRDDVVTRRALVLTALERLDAGSYGVCVDCGAPIGRERLEALPAADRCASCAGARPRRGG